MASDHSYLPNEPAMRRVWAIAERDLNNDRQRRRMPGIISMRTKAMWCQWRQQLPERCAG